MAGRPLIGRATCRAQTAARAARRHVADAQVGICFCKSWTRASTRAWTTDGRWSGAIVESTAGPGGAAMFDDYGWAPKDPNATVLDTPTPAYDFFWDEFRGEAELRTIVPNGAMFVKKRA